MQLLAAKEPLLNPPVSSDFFPHTPELESALVLSANWMHVLEDVSWCEQARHQCVQCKVPTADVREFMQHCAFAHEGFWQHRPDYVHNSILLNRESSCDTLLLVPRYDAQANITFTILHASVERGPAA